MELYINIRNYRDMIRVYSGGKSVNLPTSQESYHEVSVGAIPKVVVETTSNRELNIGIGAYCTFRGEKYYLFTAPEVVKRSRHEYQYKLTFYGEGQRLALTKFKFLVDKPNDVRLKFSLSGTPRFFLEQIVRCMGGEWKIGTCLEATSQVLSFNHEDCLASLARIAEAFKTEWRVEGKTIHLCKVEGDKTKAIPLSYGRGNGVLPGLSVENDNEHTPVGKLYVQGGDRNIDPNVYGSRTLHLPKSKQIVFEGHTYVSDSKGESLSIDGITLDGRREDSYDGTNVYPQRVGVVSGVERTKEGHYNILDKDCDVDYAKYSIAGEKATVTFQSGRLGGRTFDIAQDKEVLKYDHSTKRFLLVSSEEDGLTLPEPKAFYPEVGDKYAVFGVRLPNEYLVKAEEELMKSAIRYFHEALQPKVTYKAELDGIYAQKNWGAIGSKLVLGQFVHLTDTELNIDDKVRITAIRTKLSKEYKPQITLSNNIQAPSFSSTIGKLESEEVQRHEEVKQVRREASRSYAQASAISEGIVKALLKNFTESINPLMVKTMQLLVGDPSLQFVFIDRKGSDRIISLEVSYDSGREVLYVPSSTLRHMTIGISSISSKHDKSEYKEWDVSKLEYSVRKDVGLLYLYSRCNKASREASFVALENPVGMEHESGYYHFLVGILGGLPDRSFTRLYGFTEILPGQIRTEKIGTPDGSAYFDLVSGIIASKMIRFIHPDGSEHPYHHNDYLHKAIADGSTDILGGLLLASLIGAKDDKGIVRSFLAGDMSKPAFASGVTDFGKPEQKAITEINHDGTGHIGAMHIEQGGRVASFKQEGKEIVRIGGAQTSLDQLLGGAGQNEEGERPFNKFEYKQSSFDSETKVVSLGTMPLRVLHDGSYVEIVLPWDISVRNENVGKTKIESKAMIKVTITNSKDEVVGEVYREWLRSPSDGGWLSRINHPHTITLRGLKNDIYILAIDAHISTGIIEGDRYSGSPSYTHFSSKPFNARFTIKGVNKGVREMVFGDYGLSVFLEFTKYLYINSNPSSSYPFMVVKGDTDMPGVLLAGQVNVSGGNVEFERVWGAYGKGCTIQRVANGVYRISHSIGHHGYIVVANSLGAGAQTASAGRITDTTFDITTKHHDDSWNIINFSFIVIGDNYKK